MTPVEVIRGEGPVVLAMPHGGTWLPPRVLDALNDNGRRLADTDWHIARLYEGLLPGATVVRATVHRYAIDANRDPTGASLYPGQNTTGLIPLTDFDGKPIWAQPPGPADTAARLAAFHAPYHAALTAEMERVRDAWGVAVLYDCHSIRSEIPFLFPGKLPDFNIGTNGGLTCDPRIADAAETIGRTAGTTVVNGRFRGGWTTRHYGRPKDGWHAIQMELAQSTYLATEEPPFAWDETRAARLRPVLSAILGRIEEIALSMGAHA